VLISRLPQSLHMFAEEQPRQLDIEQLVQELPEGSKV